MQVTIRTAQMTDAAALAGLTAELGYPSTVEEIIPRLESILEDPRGQLLVAEDEENCAVGWAHVLRVLFLESDEFAEIGGLVVAEIYRGEGIGARLLQAAEDWARQQGLRSVRLRSNIIRTRSHEFYLRLGYQIAKTQYTFEKSLG